MIHRYLILFTIITLVCSSCKKEDTNNFPIISIEQPNSSVNCNVPCQFTVKGAAESTYGIEFVTVGVLTKDGTPVSAIQKKTFNKETKVSFDFIVNITDVYLTNGTYSLKVSSFNGRVVKNEFIDVFISTPPLIIENIYLASETAGVVNIYEYSSTGNVLVKTLSSDFGFLFCDSRTERIAVGGKFSDIVWMNDEFDEVARVNARSTTFPYFHNYSVNTFDNNNYINVSNEEAFINTYSSDGGIKNSFKVDNSGNSSLLPYFFQNLSSGHTLVDLEDAAKSNERLQFYFTTSGFLINTVLFANKDLVGVGDLGATSNEVFLFLNEAGVGKVYSYNTSINLINEIKSIGAEIYNVVQLSNTVYILATDAGIYRYNYSNGSSTLFNAVVATNVYLNKVDNRVLAISGNTLYWFDDLGNIANTSINPEKIEGVGVMYNK
jgi:hypothetical protein